MKLIPLTQGQFALVDDDDFEFLSRWKWCAHFQPNRSGGGAYNAVRSEPGKTILMHRVIMSDPQGMVDHKDRNPLNNQRSNLRCANHSTNGANAGIRSDNKSGHKGVSYVKSRGNFLAQIRINGKTKNLGRFPTAIEASRAYAEAAIKEFGEFVATI